MTTTLSIIALLAVRVIVPLLMLLSIGEAINRRSNKKQTH